MKNHIYSTACLLIVCSFSFAESSKHTYTPSQGYVPNETTAIKIAEAVWLPIYGKSIYSKIPFIAKLNGTVWVVEGSLPLHMRGGVPVIEIVRKTGEILRVSHGK